MSKKTILAGAVVIMAAAVVAVIAVSDDSENQIIPTQSESYAFTCPNDYQIGVRYSGENNQNARVVLSAPETYEMNRVRSASGSRYENESGSVVFWEHQGEARIEKDGEIVREGCVKQASGQEAEEFISRLDTAGKIVEFAVAPQRQPCDGGADQRECLVVNDELFYDEIDGFTFESGNQYRLRVRRTERDNPPADASGLHYELVEIISETPVEESATLSESVGQRAGLLGTSWQWQRTEYPDRENVVAENPSEFVLSFGEGGRFGASTDCNQIGGSYDSNIDAGELSFSRMVSTRMVCSEESQESAFTDMLSAVKSYRILQDGELQLTLADGLMRFQRVSQ